MKNFSVNLVALVGVRYWNMLFSYQPNPDGSLKAGSFGVNAGVYPAQGGGLTEVGLLTQSEIDFHARIGWTQDYPFLPRFDPNTFVPSDAHVHLIKVDGEWQMTLEVTMPGQPTEIILSDWPLFRDITPVLINAGVPV